MRGYERSMQRAIGQTNQTARRMETRFERANQSISRGFSLMSRAGVQALGAIGLAVGGAQLARLTGDALEAAESIYDMSRRANVSAGFLQEMRLAADQNGASFNDFDDAISRLNRRLGLFQQHLQSGEGEAGPAAAAFRALGLEARMASGELQNTEQVFNAAVAELEKIENAARRSALASQLFGEDSGPRLVQMLDLGIEGLDQFAQSMRAAGEVLEDELVEKGAEANAVIRRMRTELGTEFNRAVLENVDGLEGMAQALADIAKWGVQAAAAMGNLYQNLADGTTPDDMLQGQRLRVSMLEDRRADLLNRGGMARELRNNSDLPESQRRMFDDMYTDTIVELREVEAQLRDAQTALDNLEQRRAQLAARNDQAALNAPSAGVSVGGGGGGVNGGPAGPNFGAVNMNGEIIASADARLKPATGLGGMGSNPEADKAKELGLMQAQEYAREMERNQDKFSREFAYTFAGGFRAAFEGDLADFAAQRLRDALHDRLFTLFESLGRTLFNAINGEGGGGVLATIGKAAFGGGKAAGGPVRAGMAYRVGERGPETIIPAQNGMVLPNSAMAPMRGRESSAGPLIIKLETSAGEMFDVRVRDVAGPMAQRAQVQAVQTSRRDLGEFQKNQSTALRR